MLTETTIAGIRARLRELPANRAKVALVPTMGALHDGHLALVERAGAVADVVVVSIFINPLQFAPSEDLARYPRTLDADTEKLAQHGVTMLFAPTVGEMYPARAHTMVVPPPMADSFEGAVRPGHFVGVLTVVAKLFNITQPAAAVFGRKDLQQLTLIRLMVSDLNVPVGILDVETVRESDGLALSSRNRYLDEDARRRAARIRAALVAGQAAFESGSTSAADIEAAGRAVLAEDSALDVDYFSVVNEADFNTPATATRGGSAIVAAVRVGGTRLIDNISL